MGNVIKKVAMLNIKVQVNHWKKSAEKNWDAANILFKNKHYDFCLFTCHLAIEKLLKGLVVFETKDFAPYIHNLEKLANLANLSLNDEQVQNLRIITEFNIAGRYTDAKFAFYKRCAREFTARNLKICEEIYLWLKKQYLKL